MTVVITGYPVMTTVIESHSVVHRTRVVGGWTASTSTILEMVWWRVFFRTTLLRCVFSFAWTLRVFSIFDFDVDLWRFVVGFNL